MTERRAVWKIQLAVVATQAEVDGLKDSIRKIMCPDPDHAPPCPIPWQISAQKVDDDETELYSTLIHQAEIESKRSI
jgi:hypothetical protein